MRRREFIKIITGSVAALPIAALGQQLPTVGFMGADASAFIPWTPAFVQRLGELGWGVRRSHRLDRVSVV